LVTPSLQRESPWHLEIAITSSGFGRGITRGVQHMQRENVPIGGVESSSSWRHFTSSTVCCLRVGRFELKPVRRRPRPSRCRDRGTEPRAAVCQADFICGWAPAVDVSYRVGNPTAGRLKYRAVALRCRCAREHWAQSAHDRVKLRLAMPNMKRAGRPP